MLDPLGPPTEGWTVGSHWVRNDDGTVSGQFYPQPEFRQVGDSWLRIDPSLAVSAAGAYVSAGSLVPISFGLSKSNLTTLTLASGPVVESLTTGPDLPLVGELDGQTLTYPDVAASTDLHVTVGNTGIKEELVLQDASAPTTFHFHLSDPGNALGGVAQSDPDTYQFDTAVAPDTYLELPRPFAYEQTPQPSPLAAEPGSAHQTVVAAGDGYDVTLFVDPDWLVGKDYPIVLDPSATFKNSNLTVLQFNRYSSGHSGCGSDGGGCLGYVPPANNPNALGAGSQTEIGSGGKYLADGRPARAYYKFSISQILPGSDISSAQLLLYRDGCIGYAEYNCDAHDYTEEWHPLTAAITASGSTYDDFAAATGAVQNTKLISAYPANTRVQDSFNIKGVVTYWIGSDPDGYAHTNHGFAERLTAEPSSNNIGGPSFAGPNDTTYAHPEVDVTWTPPPCQMAAPALAAYQFTALLATYNTPCNSGTAIDSYRIKLYRVGDSTPYRTNICDNSSNSCSSTLFGNPNTDPLPYDSYYVTAQAHNSAGYGATSPQSNTVTLTPPPPPGQMTAPTLSATSNTSLHATFSPPSNAGTPINTYRVDLYKAGAFDHSKSCTSPCTFVDFGQPSEAPLDYNTYYVTATAISSAGAGQTSPASNSVTLLPAPVLTKSVSPLPAGRSSYRPGESATYTVHIANPASTAMTVNTLTDTMPGTLNVAGSSIKLANSDCLSTGACSVSGSTITANNISIPGNGSVDLVYSAVVNGVSRACTTLVNTATATNAYGSDSKSVSIPVCDSGLGVEPWWSYFTRSIAAQSRALVNAMNGNLVVQATDSTPIPTRGHFAYVIRRSYNSQDPTLATLPGTIGAGWQLNIGQADDLAGLGITASGLDFPQAPTESAPLAVTMIDRDGTRHVFTYRSASINIHSPLDVTSPLTGPLGLMRAVNPLLLPAGSGFAHVCVDAMYQAPAGVHVSLWRYVGTSNACSAVNSSAQVLGFAAVRTDRLRYEFDAAGHLLDMIDGSGVDLRYTYGLGRLSSIYEPRSCTGTVGGPTCRAVTVTYPSSTEVDVTDPAGRLTKYMLDTNTPAHLVQVINPPETQQGGTDHVSYAYQGYGVSCGGTNGQLCTITDARGTVTRITYTGGPLGMPRVASYTDRLGTQTTFSYVDSNPAYVTADTGNHRVRYANIDSTGRVGEIDEGDTSNNFLHVTRYTWDTAAAPCAYIFGSLTGTHATWNRQENNLCQFIQVNGSGLPTETTDYAYSPEGALLSQRQDMPGAADLYTTYAYFTQYIRSGGNAALTARDQVAGSGDVQLGNRSAATGDGAGTAGDPNALYSITDQEASLPPRGNAAGANVANFTTAYTVADNVNAQPDSDPGSSSCGSRNSGSICSISAPFDGADKSVTTYTYDGFGQKVTASVPKSAYESTPAGQTTTYTYSYYPATSLDLSGTVSANGWLQAVTDPAQHFVAFGYDQAGNVTRTWDRNATTGAASPTTFLTNPNNRYHQTLHAPDLNTRPWRYVLNDTDPVGNTTSYTVDADGNQTAITTARGNTITQQFDNDDDLTQRTTPLEAGHPAVMHYDQFGNLDYSRTRNGAYTVRRYDAVNRLTTTFTDRGPSATTTKPAACVVTDTGSNAHPPIPTGEVVCYRSTSYDMADNVLSSTDGDGQTTTYTYDAANRRLTTTTPRAPGVTNTTTVIYDENGNITDTCPPRQPSPCSRTGVYSTHNSYNQADELTKTTTYRQQPTNPHGAVVNTNPTTTVETDYAYDADGNRTTTTDANGHVTTSTYDFLDRLTAITTPRDGDFTVTTNYTYDPAGNRTSTSQPGLLPGDGHDGNLTIGAPYSKTDPYPLPNNTQYKNLTLTGGAWATAATTTPRPVALSISVQGKLTICPTCGITVDGLGYRGGTAGVGAPGTNGGGPGGGGGSGNNGVASGGGGGGGHAVRGADGDNGFLGNSAGGPGGTGGPRYGSEPTGAASDAGSGGGGSGGSGGLLRIGGARGGDGGGAIHISAGTIANSGTITAVGLRGADGEAGEQGVASTGGGGGGSGGSIWLSANTITQGTLSVSGGAGGAAGSNAALNATGTGGAGAVGYLRLDSANSATRTGTGVSTHPIGLITAYSYDADNRLIDTVTGADNTNAAQAGLPSSDGGSHIRTRLHYDPDGNIDARYDPRAFLTSATTPDRRFETVSRYDADGRLTDIYEPYADSGTYSDPLGGPATGEQCTDAAATGVDDYSALIGVRVCFTHYDYDYDGNRIAIQLPTFTSGHTNRVYRYTYTPDELFASETIPDPSATSGSNRITDHAYTYDGSGRTVKDQQLTAQAPATVVTYTSDGLTATTTPPAGPVSHTITYGYDNNGNQTSVTRTQDASTTRTSYTDYNSDNTVADQVDPAGNTTSYGYDAAGNATAVYSPSANAGDTTNPNHLPTTYTFYDDNLLRTTSTPTRASGNQLRLTTYNYDAAGRKTNVDTDYTDATGTVTVNGNPQGFGYYPDSLLSTSTGRDGGTQTRRYDAAGNLASATDTPNGGTPTTTNATYYLDSQTRTVDEGNNTSKYSYDAAGALAVRRDTTTAGTQTLTQTTAYTYYDHEDLATITGGATNTPITYNYDDQGRPTTTSYDTGPVTTRTWNPDNTLATQTVKTGGNTINRWQYTYDGMYRITAADNNLTDTGPNCAQSPTSITPVDGLQCMSYDPAGRVSTFRDHTAARAANYDADGNRTGYGPNAGATCNASATTACFTFNPDDSIATQATSSVDSYTYTRPFGGITSDGCSTYTYDGFDRLAKTDGNGSTGCDSTINYTYDALDRQTARAESGSGAVQPGNTAIAYDGLTDATTSEVLPDSSTTSYTVEPDGAPIAVSTTTGTNQLLADDGRGNITTGTSTAGTLACAMRYDPWGIALDVANPGSAGHTANQQICTNVGGTTPDDLQYRAGRRDTTSGAYQFGSRTYDPTKAAFLSPDSYRNAQPNLDLSIGTDPLTRNTYNYVNGDPLNFADPSGHSRVDLPEAGPSILERLFAALFGSVTGGSSGPAAAAPRVDNPDLQNVLDQIYHPQAEEPIIGTGKAGDAVINEIRTGDPTNGAFHIKDALDLFNRLRRIVNSARQPGGRELTDEEIAIAEQEANELQAALQTPDERGVRAQQSKKLGLGKQLKKLNETKPYETNVNEYRGTPGALDPFSLLDLLANLPSLSSNEGFQPGGVSPGVPGYGGCGSSGYAVMAAGPCLFPVQPPLSDLPGLPAPGWPGTIFVPEPVPVFP